VWRESVHVSRGVSREISSKLDNKLVQQLGKELARVDVHHACNLDEFDYVDTPLAGFYSADERMGPFEARGQVSLR
jgi:hypothetical protein